MCDLSLNVKDIPQVYYIIFSPFHDLRVYLNKKGQGCLLANDREEEWLSVC